MERWLGWPFLKTHRKNSVDFSHLVLRAVAQHLGSLASPPRDLGWSQIQVMQFNLIKTQCRINLEGSGEGSQRTRKRLTAQKPWVGFIIIIATWFSLEKKNKTCSSTVQKKICIHIFYVIIFPKVGNNLYLLFLQRILFLEGSKHYKLRRSCWLVRGQPFIYESQSWIISAFSLGLSW